VKIGFLRSTASMEELREEMGGLEEAGCERIILDNSLSATPNAGTLGAVISRLSDGDQLTVWSLDCVASSMSELVELILQLESRNVRFRSLKEGFDSHGRHRASLRATLEQLMEFQRQLKLRQQQEAAAHHARRVGRPRALSEEDIERAQRLLNEGRVMDDVAKELHVSRATLYRYLDESHSKGN
jgi:DNA invertase Pin-like site-specific DNA recombinase